MNSMPRNNVTEAVVLSLMPKGENNRSVRLFTPDDGIIWATLYGGPKSKMKGLVSPFNRGKMYVYRDNAKNLTKITDFDVQNFHPSFRESLFKSWSATLASELVIKTKCAGSPGECWTLFNGFLDGLELSDEMNGRLGLVRFLWRYISLLGVCPDTYECTGCGEPFFTGNFTDNKVSSSHNFVFYSRNENGFCCKSCSDGNGFQISMESLSYLCALSEKSPKEVRALQISAQAVNEMKQLVFYLIETAVGQKLASIESGLGIL